MKTLILGNGAREHALAWAFSRSKRNSGIFCMPGNAGMVDFALNVPGDPTNAEAVVSLVRRSGADLVVIGPEAPLEAGVADALRAAGIAVFGPGKLAAQLECSKSFARDFSDRAGVPSAKTDKFDSLKDFEKYLAKKKGIKLVLKKSGLAAGKGVLESDDAAEMLAFARTVLADDELLVEEYLTGYELSIFALSDGTSYHLMPACADHKKAFAGNKGPNTGGMGAMCPVPCADRNLMETIEATIIKPTFARMAKEKLNYRGVLFFGVMVTKDGPKLLEYNVRFGDPETQSLIPLLASDIADVFEALCTGTLADVRIEYKDLSAVGITVAAPGYPGEYPKGLEVRGLPGENSMARVFHAGTARGGDGILRTGGGRCFTAVGLGADYFEAYKKAVEMAGKVDFDGAWFRHDIGKSFFIE